MASASRMVQATLAAGQCADFVWLDAGLNAVQTWIGGRPVSAERIAA